MDENKAQNEQHCINLHAFRVFRGALNTDGKRSPKYTNTKQDRLPYYSELSRSRRGSTKYRTAPR